MVYDLSEYIRRAYEEGASDIHICAGSPVKYRLHGSIKEMDPAVLSAQDCADSLRALAGEECLEAVMQTGEQDTSLPVGDVRIRINVYRQQKSFSAAIRILKNKIPDFNDLNLPEQVKSFVELRRGLVLVTGVTGSGKTTTMAAVLDQICRTRACHIVTLEDPIEYIFKAEKGVVSQREVGTDTASFSNGLRAALREDPDVIYIGELRDRETMQSAVEAAETGHLVFATLHTKSAAETVDRLIEGFPVQEQAQIRIQLASSLEAVLSQQLLPDMRTGKRILAAELMLLNPAIRTLIREGKTHQIDNAIMTGAREGCISMDASLQKLFMAGRVSRTNCIEAAYDPDQMKRNLMRG